MGDSGEEILFLVKSEICKKIEFLFDKKHIKNRLILNELCIEKNKVGIYDLNLEGGGKLWMGFPKRIHF
ncbi:MAG: hypothetical protein ACJAT4_000333 [Granulosicoccus sp.]